MNGSIRLHSKSIHLIEKAKMFERLAVLLAAHNTGLTMGKSIVLLKRYADVVSCLEPILWISENLLAFPIVGRSKDGPRT